MILQKLKSTALAISALLILIVAAVISFLYIGQSYNTNILKNAQYDLGSKTNTMSMGIEKLFLEHLQQINGLINDPIIIKVLKERNNKIFYGAYCPVRNLYELHKEDFVEILLINTEGKIFHKHPNPLKELIDISDDKDVQTVLQKKETLVSRIFIDSLNLPCISILQPIFQKDNFIGIVNFIINPKIIRDIYVDELKPETETVMLLDSNSKVLFTNIPEFCGKNVLELIKKDKKRFPEEDYTNWESFVSNQSNADQSNAIFNFRNHHNKSTDKVLAVYHSLVIGNALFHLNIYKKYNQITTGSNSFTKQLIAILIGVLLIMLFILYVLVKNARKSAQLKEKLHFLKNIEDKAKLINEQNIEYESLHEEYKTLNEELRERNEELMLSKLEIEQSEKKFRNYFVSNYAIMMFIDPATQQIVDANNAAVHFYGYTKESLLKMKMSEINIIPKEKIGIKMKDAIKKNANYFQFKHKIANGNIRDVETYATPMIVDKRQLLTVLIHDVTDRKRAENELIAAISKAEESDRLKTAFLANMSHEIRTPMNGIVGFAELLNRKGLSEKKRQKYTDIISNNSEQLLSIVNDVLDIAKIEAGQTELDERELNLGDLIQGLYETFKPRVNEKGLKLICKVNDDKITISADETKLRQIIANLLNNALKFTHEGNIEIGEICSHDFVEIYVKDTGIGIEKNQTDIIFERFRQLELTATRKYGGTGLGLSISKAYAEKMGGKITLESKMGEGSKFSLFLPNKNRVYQKPNIKLVSNEKKINWNEKTILVAEDDQTVFVYLHEVLAEKQVQVLRAYNGKEAVDICRNTKKIDLVLMDIKMPVMDGYKATKIIKGFNPNIPIVVQTAFALSGDSQKAFDAGCDDYITKPIEEAKLWSVLRKNL